MKWIPWKRPEVAATEDLTYFLEEDRRLWADSDLVGDEYSVRLDELISRAETTLNEADFKQFQEVPDAEMREERQGWARRELAEDALKFLRHQRAQHLVYDEKDLPIDVRLEVLRRARIAEAFDAPGLAIVYGEDHSFEVLVNVRAPYGRDADPQPCEVCAGQDERPDDGFGYAYISSRAAELGYACQRWHQACRPLGHTDQPLTFTREGLVRPPVRGRIRPDEPDSDEQA